MKGPFSLLTVARSWLNARLIQQPGHTLHILIVSKLARYAALIFLFVYQTADKWTWCMCMCMYESEMRLTMTDLFLFSYVRIAGFKKHVMSWFNLQAQILISHLFNGVLEQCSIVTLLANNIISLLCCAVDVPAGFGLLTWYRTSLSYQERVDKLQLHPYSPRMAFQIEATAIPTHLWSPHWWLPVLFFLIDTFLSILGFQTGSIVILAPFGF